MITISGERTAAVNALTALVRVANLGIDARRPLTGGQITAMAAWRSRDEDVATAVARKEAVRLAKHVIAADRELTANTKQMTDLGGRSDVLCMERNSSSGSRSIGEPGGMSRQ